MVFRGVSLVRNIQIWETNQISNGGILNQGLIKALNAYLGIENPILTANETKIEESIIEKTPPCNIEKIEGLAQKYNLKVIYDAAHAFGVTYNGESIFKYGDVITCCFNTTKIFHTGEGGGMFSTD